MRGLPQEEKLIPRAQGSGGKRCERGLEPSEARLTGVPRALLRPDPLQEVQSGRARGHLRHAGESFYPQFLVEPLTNRLEGKIYLKSRQVPGVQRVNYLGVQGFPRNSPSFHRLSPNTLSWGAGVK